MAPCNKVEESFNLQIPTRGYPGEHNKRAFWGFVWLRGTCSLGHLFMAPYDKVEESFNLQVLDLTMTRSSP